ncbi:MAG: tetratricopeptide repeat protein [candidate division Zixibacteria bacterium]|nr:tetratricopeptide repeat protein [candidate division Zixibacteria bacterium]
MSGANHNHLCRQLYAYELGMLEGEQLDEFEIHLLECPRCRKEAAEFLPTAQLLKRDVEVRGLVEGLSLETPEPKSSRRYYFQTLLAIAAVVTFLVLKPWNIEFKPTQEIIAAENRLAVLYIGGISENEDDLTLGHTLAGLLTADLSESNYIQVVSSQRLYDAALHLGLADPNRIDQSHAGALAHEVGAKWMLTASIAADRKERRLVTQLFDVTSGDIQATQTAVMDSSKSVFDLVDQLSVQFKADLGLPDQAMKEPDPRVADVTSHSIEAYKMYLKGIEFRQRMYFNESADCFLKAIAKDSAFAMAYYYLSLSFNPPMIQKAVKYSSRATKREQMFIEARAAQVAGDTVQTLAILKSITEQSPDEKDAFFQLGEYYYVRRDYDRAIFYFKKCLMLDPLHRPSYNELAYCYEEDGQLSEALRTLDEYERVAPDEPNPLDSRGDILARNGRLKEAIDSYARAVKKEPSFYASKTKLYYAYLADGQYEQAEGIYREWEAQCAKFGCANAYWAKANALIFRGQYRDGLAWLDKAIGEDSVLSIGKKSSSLEVLHSAKTQLLLAMDSSAVAEAEVTIKYLLTMRPDDKVTYRITLVRALAQAGLSDSAQQIVEQIHKDLEAAGSSMFSYWMAKGYLELWRRDGALAAESFDSATSFRPKRLAFLTRFLQGQALVVAGQAEKAIEVLAAQENSFTDARLKDYYTNSRIYYYLARAYEASGQTDSAITRYERFLSIWENADSTLPELIDARQRLARLRANP